MVEENVEIWAAQKLQITSKLYDFFTMVDENVEIWAAQIFQIHSVRNFSAPWNIDRGYLSQKNEQLFHGSNRRSEEENHS